MVDSETPFPFAKPPPGEEIVICGMAGNFPKTTNLHELRHALYNGIDMVTDDSSITHPDIPKRCGRLNNDLLSKFDFRFFGVPQEQVVSMDPLIRMILEKAYEAIIDAGLSPEELRGTNTGVYSGSSFSEADNAWYSSMEKIDGYGVIGSSKAMLANRISYWLDLKGPSYNVDTACSSTLYAIDAAYRDLRTGIVDYAIVGTANLCLTEMTSLQFTRLGVLSNEGRCRTFDENASGYVRSETVACMVLMKAKDAKRIYGYVVHSKTNCDGYKPQGITYPSSQSQTKLLKDFYKDITVLPKDVAYLECHGTGTKVGDLEECISISAVFCKDRVTPLKIGSIKSNLGHAEPSSGACSIAKCILTMESGIIPPNLNFHTPRKEVRGLYDGSLSVVTKKTPLEGDYVGVSGFGFGGANAHLLLKRFAKKKINNGCPNDDLPRLVCISGRTQEAVNALRNDLRSRSLDAEYVRLFHNIYHKNIRLHNYRGYVLLQKAEPHDIGHANKYIEHNVPLPSVCYVFSGIGSQWSGMGASLMKIPVFAATMRKLNKYLDALCRLDIIQIITDINPKFYENPLYAILGITAIQIGLVDVLKAIGVEPDYIIGYSIGELACAYADNCLTDKQTILVAYYRGLALFDSKLIKGSMAVCDLNSNELGSHCSSEIDLTGEITEKSSIISGPADMLKKITSEVSLKGISTREIKTSNIEYHSKHIESLNPRLRKELKKLIPNPKAKSQKWICSEETKKMNNNHDEYCTSEYLANIIHTQINLKESFKNIQSNTLIIEISPDNLLVDVLKKVVKNNTFVGSLMHRYENNLTTFFTTIGNLYTKGLNPQLANLYPEVQFPVSCGTPMIAPLVKWDHSSIWPIPEPRYDQEDKTGHTFEINMSDPRRQYLSGHIIDGRNLFPATGYLTLVWESLIMAENEFFENASVIFEDIQFLRATNIPKDNTLTLYVMIQPGSGYFEITESDSVVVVGYVHRIPHTPVQFLKLPKVETIVNDKDLLPLNSRDVYKELRLRGYNYQGDFQSIIKTDNSCHVAEIKWKPDNWTPFIDNMLQLQILQESARFLYVPTSIRKLTIHPQEHVEYINEHDDGKCTITVTNHEEYSVIKGGGVQIEGLVATSINRRKPLGDAVLETQEFIPFISPISQKYSNTDAMRIILQLSLENQPITTVKVIEVDNEINGLLGPMIFEVLGDLPLIQADITVLSKQSHQLPENIKISNKSLESESKADYVVAFDLINNSDMLTTASKVLKDTNGFILSRENPKSKSNSIANYNILCELFLEDEKIVLLRKKRVNVVTPEIIRITNDTQFPWLHKLQAATKTNTSSILYAQNEPTSGIIGLVNCLRKEYLNNTIRAVFIDDKNAPTFDIKNQFYKDQLDIGLAVNVYKNGKWGSYRHLKLYETKYLTDTAYINVKTRGDLSSMTWIDLPLSGQQKKIIDISYAAFNFRDIMTATGKLGIDYITTCSKGTDSILPPDCVQGLEFSGYDRDGKRYMGLVGRAGLATRVEVDSSLLWPVPDNWTLEDAATVPAVYATVYYSLVKHGLSKGHSVLIHAGTGGIGISAINVALHYGCEVFTTVGTPEKRQFIKKIFPQIKESHIGNSRDTTFEQMIMRETNGRGVDFVLNSLAEEKLLASVRCLAEHGKFMEIGKFDLSKNNKLGMEVFMRGAMFCGIMLDNLFYGSDKNKDELFHAVLKGIKEGAVKPLPRTIFSIDNLEAPFRYMAAGKHLGKVLLKIRDEETQQPIMVPAIPKLYINRNKTVVIIGGLGGFGLELADWLIQRGCRSLVLSSRQGLKKGYQAIRVQKWRSAGVNVQISTANVSTKQGCIEILEFAKKFSPVDGIYNLAVLLRDALFENQTVENFQTSFSGKVLGTKYLDEVSRSLCPELRHFIVFSSVSCGRGNAGQTNYGMANSVMERICEERSSAGYPALAIQWGAIGEVGLVADMQDDDTILEIGGTLQQTLQSCFDALDIFVKQKSTVVASMVVAEKKSGGSSNVLDAVINIMGLRDYTTISKHVSLAEIGMDSMMAVEIKQTLEREFEIFLTAQDIRNLTISKLIEFQTLRGEGGELSSDTNSQENIFKMFVRTLGDENHLSEPLVKLPSQNDTTDNSVPLFFMPGIEGQSTVFEIISSKLNHVCYGLQVPFTDTTDNISELTQKMTECIKSKLVPKQDYHIVAYSFGSILATEVARNLDKLGHKGRCLYIDGSPTMVKNLIEKQFEMNDDLSLNTIESRLLIMALSMFKIENVTHLLADLEALPDWNSRLDLTISKIPDNEYSEEYSRIIFTGIFARFYSVLKYKLSSKNLNARIQLIRPTTHVISDMPEDYNLSELMANKEPIPVTILEGNHYTVLENPELPTIINAFFQ